MRIKLTTDHGRFKMVKNDHNCEVRWVEFKGKHPYFVEGKSYTITEYADWTNKHGGHGYIPRASIKGRLTGRVFCEPHCLLPTDGYVEENRRQAEKLGVKESVARRFLRLESKAERLSDKYLRVKL